jgi:DNA-binding GntR family transcriptional regulator
MDNLKIDAASVLKTRDEFVADKLREAILRGYFRPGRRIEENEIADLLNVSRSPVREALRTLAAEGLVEVYPHRGAIVAEISAEELEEIYFLRGVLEGMAAHLAVPKMDADRIAKLQIVLQELNETTDPDRWLDLNRSFHRTIYQAANRPRLLAITENLRNTAAPYIRQYIVTTEHFESSRISHQRILEACQKRDGMLAQEETQKHLKAMCDGVLVYMGSLMDNSQDD